MSHENPTDDTMELDRDFALDIPVDHLLGTAKDANLQIDLSGKNTIDSLRKSILGLRRTIKGGKLDRGGVENLWGYLKSAITNLEDPKVVEFYKDLNEKLGAEIDEKLRNMPNRSGAVVKIPGPEYK